MTKPPPPRVQMLLRVWAGKLERNLLDGDEIASLAQFIRRLSRGETVDEVFGIKRTRGRPKSPALEQQLWDMAYMRLPVPLGGEGMTYSKTIAITAKRYKKPRVTIIADYKSDRSQEVRDSVKAEAEFAASLGFGQRWEGRNIQDLNSRYRV